MGKHIIYRPNSEKEIQEIEKSPATKKIKTAISKEDKCTLRTKF